MRAVIAKLLVRCATRVLAGPDDRIVWLNTQRRRSRVDGRVHAFIGQGSQRRAFAEPRDGKVSDLGTAVPVRVATLAGWSTYGPGE